MSLTHRLPVRSSAPSGSRHCGPADSRSRPAILSLSLGVLALALASAVPARASAILVPLDGVWQAESRLVEVSCGPHTALARAHLEALFRKARPVRIRWTDGFRGATFETAWRATNPARNQEAQPWRADGPRVQRADIARRDRRSSARLELLAPDHLRLDWTLTTWTELSPCTISATQELRHIGE
ncbi:hypothetical protein ACRC7T_03745 [Segnochrobactraceae bacterium EtOH-i3]